jgi:hypothetical protein
MIFIFLHLSCECYAWNVSNSYGFDGILETSLQRYGGRTPYMKERTESSIFELK